jgi:hypothetical protein
MAPGNPHRRTCRRVRFDWDTLTIDHPDKETTRTIVQSYSDDPVQVFVHYARAELFLGSHLAHLQASGMLSPDAARRWWEYLQHADKHGTLLISFTAFIVVGARN